MQAQLMVTTVQDAYDACLKDAAALLPGATPYLSQVNACKKRSFEFDHLNFDLKNFLSEFETVEPVETDVGGLYKLEEPVEIESFEPVTEI